MASNISKRRFLVVGLGEMGKAVALTLAEAGAEVIALDIDMHLVDEVKDRVTYAVQGASDDLAVLRAIEAQHADVAVITIGRNFDATVLTVSALRDMGVKQIIARASNDRRRRVLEQVGATRVLAVEEEAGHSLSRALLSPHVLDLQELAPGYDVVEWRVPQSFVGQTLAQIDFRRRFGLLVIAIRRTSKAPAEIPEPDWVLTEDTVLFVAGRHKEIEKLSQL